MVKLDENARGYKLSRKDVPFTKLVVERTNTNPDWVNQPSHWGAHYVLDDKGLYPLLTLDMRAAGEKYYDHNELVVFQVGEVSNKNKDKALQGLRKEHNIPTK